jgi:hypothetical protein
VLKSDFERIFREEQTALKGGGGGDPPLSLTAYMLIYLAAKRVPKEIKNVRITAEQIEITPSQSENLFP